MENTDINYFTLQQYIDELTKNNLISKNQTQGKAYYSITKEGKKILDLFIGRLPENWSNEIDNYISKNKSSILDEVDVLGTIGKRVMGNLKWNLKY